MPTFSIPQLRSGQVRDFGAGNVSTFKKLVNHLVKLGIKHICLQPIHETEPGMASLFSRSSSNALSQRLLDLAEIPEIKNDRGLSSKLQIDLDTAAKVTTSSKTDLAMVEVVHGHYLRSAHLNFKALPESAQRKPEFKAYCEKHSWWLEKYAYFRGLKEAFRHLSPEQWDKDYADMESEKAKVFIKDNIDGINYFKYVQMEIYRQVKEALDYAKEAGIEEIEALIGVGIGRESAEGFLMPEIFDASRQIGCYPEPENGYPIQLWGFLAEKNNDGLLEFKARSLQNMAELGVDRIGLDHACGFLGGYTTFPVHDPIVLKSGSYRELNAADPADAKTAERDGRHAFVPGQEEDQRQAFAHRALAALLKRTPDMKFTAETVGDKNRREAAEGAIAQKIAQGFDITLMRALPWEDVPLAEYVGGDRLSLTHDMPALIGLLTGQAGDWTYPWIDGKFVTRILSKFGILAPQLEGPVRASDLTREFMLEIHRRIIAGSGAGTVVLPLASLFTLNPNHLNSDKWQYTNIQPGTSGEVNNPLGNWEQRLPVVEDLSEAEEAVSLAVVTTSRPFGRVTNLAHSAEDIFQAQIKQVKTESVAYQAASGKWTVWDAPEAISPVLEFAIAYHGPEVKEGLEGKAWRTYKFPEAGLERSERYQIKDLLTGLELERTGEELIDHGLAIGLNMQASRHHFVIYAALDGMQASF